MDRDNYYAEKLEQERRIEEVLMSQRDPVTKVQQIIKIGLEEEEANELVAKLKEKDVDSFRFTSAQGEEVKPLG